MKYKHLLSRLGMGAAGLILAGHSFAIGTDADVTVSNAVTMDYSVNSVAQTASTSVDFEVDRRTDDYAQQRGREQVIYDQHPEADLNRQRPISPRNKNCKKYLDAAKKVD